MWRESTQLKNEFLFEIFVAFCVPVVQGKPANSHVAVATTRNSRYRSCAHGQSLLSLQLRADEAKGSIQWKMTL